MRLAAALLLALATPVATQLPVGTFVGAVDPAIGRPGTPAIALEPLTGSIQPIRDPAALFPSGVTAALPANGAASLILGAVLPSGSGQLVAAALAGTSIASVRPLTGNLGERIVGLAPLPDGRTACLTRSRLLAVPVAGGRPALLTAATPGARFVAVTRFADSVVAVETSLSAAGTRLHFVQPATGSVSVRAVALAHPTAMEFEPSLGGFVVADAVGGLHLIEPARLIVSSLGSLGAPVAAIARNGDQANLAIATPNAVWILFGGGTGRPIPAPPLVSLAYVPYASTFRTYGLGCGTGARLPSIDAGGTPHPGSVDFVVRLRHATPGTAAFLLLGLVPNALPLDRIGMPSCTLLVDPLDALPTRTTSLGTTATRLRIPPDPGIVGVSLHLQWAVQSPGANHIGLLLSDAGRATP